MKKLISLVLVIACLCFVGCSSDTENQEQTVLVDDVSNSAASNNGKNDGEKVTVYLPDYPGSQVAVVDASEVDDYLEEGWYTEPVVYLYNENGAKVFYEDEVEDALKKGWFDEPITESENANESELDDYYASDRMDSQKNDWMVEYAKILRNVIEDTYLMPAAKFALIYINNDDYPELVYRVDSSHTAGACLYTASEKGVSQLYAVGYDGGKYEYFGTWGEFSYKEKENLFCAGGMNQGHIYCTVYSISDNSTQTLCDFSDTTGTGFDDRGYYINEVSVSKEEYDLKQAEYGFGEDGVYKYVFDEDSYELTAENVDMVFGK